MEIQVLAAFDGRNQSESVTNAHIFALHHYLSLLTLWTSLVLGWHVVLDKFGDFELVGNFLAVSQAYVVPVSLCRNREDDLCALVDSGLALDLAAHLLDDCSTVG